MKVHCSYESTRGNPAKAEASTCRASGSGANGSTRKPSVKAVASTRKANGRGSPVRGSGSSTRAVAVAIRCPKNSGTARAPEAAATSKLSQNSR